MRSIVATLVVTAFLAIGAQQTPPQEQIDKAIKSGADFLIKKHQEKLTVESWEYELVIYTLIHADVNPKKVTMLSKGINDLISHEYPLKDAKEGGEARMTYRAAIRALALHSLLLKIKKNKDYAGYKGKMTNIQEKIAECGQYLVDTQKNNGQWSYGGVLVNTPERKGNISTGGMAESKGNEVAGKEAWENASNLTGILYKLKPKYGGASNGTDVGKPLELGEEKGDNSNTQYGILGLIAAQMSGCEVPHGTWELALKWFEKCQWSDGGFGYQEGDGGGGTAQQGPQVNRRVGRGRVEGSSGTMTTAGTVGLAASMKYLGKDYRNDPRFQKALKWLGDNFSVTETPKAAAGATPSVFVHYYLYGLERVGAFAGTPKFGSHDWYAEGATELLKTQKPDGSWLKEPHWKGKGDDLTITCDTCFAILFLKRATSEIIETGMPLIEQK